MRYLLLTTLVLFYSCQNQLPQNEILPGDPVSEYALSKDPAIPSEDKFKTGEVIKDIRLHGDPSQSYALFLPSGYSSHAKYPVIIFFDPHGDGTVPLNLYNALAGEFSYILIGSNNSKNGMSWEQTGDVARKLINEVKTRFSLDDKRIALSGFSGGAKVALVNAVSSPDVSAIIYCGAVVPIANPVHSLSLIGFGGTRDMNYSDEVIFDRNLKENVKHYLIEWGGKHEWPNIEVFRDAFLFLKTGSVENYSGKLPKISDEQLAAEQNYKQTYINAFQLQDLSWWKKEIAMLNSNAQNNAMYTRLLGYISLACYSYAGNALRQNNLTEAEKILNIYQLADPGNKDCEKFLVELKKKKSGN